MTNDLSQQQNPETKVMHLRYTGEEAFVAESQSGHAIVTSFSHDQMSAPSPMELLLIALGGCTGADVISILEKKRQRVTAYEIEVRGSRRDEHPRIYTHIEVIHCVRGYSVDERAVARAIELSRRSIAVSRPCSRPPRRSPHAMRSAVKMASRQISELLC